MILVFYLLDVRNWINIFVFSRWQTRNTINLISLIERWILKMNTASKIENLIFLTKNELSINLPEIILL